MQRSGAKALWDRARQRARETFRPVWFSVARQRARETFRPVWFSVAFLLLGGLFVYLGRHDKLREWAPNVAVAAFVLAITITVVDWIVRSEARRRLKPRTQQVIDRMPFDLRSAIEAIVIDYAETHTDSFREIPANPMTMLDQWLVAWRSGLG